MTAQHVPNKKLEGFTNEELRQELLIREAILASWTGAVAPTGAAATTAPREPAKETSGPPAAPAAGRRGRRRKAAARKGGVSAQVTKPASPTSGAAKKRTRRGISPSGKTTAQYAIEALKTAGGTQAPSSLVPLMVKAGWVTKSPEPEAVVTTTLKKAAAQKKVKKLDGKNEFRAISA